MQKFYSIYSLYTNLSLTLRKENFLQIDQYYSSNFHVSLRNLNSIKMYVRELNQC